MIEELVSRVFAIRNAAHLAHLASKSYSEHKALGKFYPEIVDLADKFAEMYQGKYGLIGPIALMSADKSSNVLTFLEKQVSDIVNVRYDVVDKECTPLQNVIDEIVGLYYTTIYKLKFLA